MEDTRRLGEDLKLSTKRELEQAMWGHQVSLSAHGRWWGQEAYAKENTSATRQLRILSTSGKKSELLREMLRHHLAHT